MNEEQRKKLYGILNNLHENSEYGAKKYWSDEEAVHHHFSRVKRWTTGASVATSSLVGVSLLIPRVREHKRDWWYIVHFQCSSDCLQLLVCLNTIYAE